MVVLQARPVLLVACAVWVVWRALLWRRRPDKNPTRELAVAILFCWSLVIVRVTFFPLTIIFYDWHGASNLVPFASILQLLRETPAVFAFENIVGNLVLFVPLGVLLPFLFAELRRPAALLWRAGVISLLIEGTQFLTRARSVDVDDVILNTTGAIVGLGVYMMATAMLKRIPSGAQFLGRLASTDRREPLLAGAFPLVVTAAIAVPMLLTTVVGQTLSGGPDGIEAVALVDLPGAQIVAEREIGDHTFLLAASETSPGGSVRLSEFEKVMPGRFTWLTTADSTTGTGPRYDSYITAFNPSVGEQPILVVWGTNAHSAAAVQVNGNGVDSVLPLDIVPGDSAAAFVTGIEFAYDETVGIADEFELTFLDGAGSVLADFRPADE